MTDRLLSISHSKLCSAGEASNARTHAGQTYSAPTPVITRRSSQRQKSKTNVTTLIG